MLMDKEAQIRFDRLEYMLFAARTIETLRKKHPDGWFAMFPVELVDHLIEQAECWCVEDFETAEDVIDYCREKLLEMGYYRE